MIRFDVHDLPAPQGSKRAIVNKGGKVSLIESSRQVKPWREAVKLAALDAYDYCPTALSGPLLVLVDFSMPRPKSHYRTGRNADRLRGGAPIAPARTPDLDKLLRSTFDALTAAGIWGDDAQVVDVCARKTYAGTTLPFVGARITVDHYRPTRCQVCGEPADDAVCAGCGGAA